MDIEANLLEYVNGKNGVGGIHPTERYASFDYCFNYFQGFRETGRVLDLAAPANMQSSCLQLGYYLASWGMLRGAAPLLQKSAKAYEPVIETIARTPQQLWQFDCDSYTIPNIRTILRLKEVIGLSLHSVGDASDTLVSKIMLGVFGNVPAFDRYVRAGLGVSSFGLQALVKIGRFYDQHCAVIDRCRVPTLDFSSGRPTERLYTRAKVIDMVFFIEGLRKAEPPALTV